MNEFEGPGFYYHYKHDPTKDIYNYSYEVMGISVNSETDEKGILYRPLYKNNYFAGRDFTNRPYDMFLENVERDGKVMKRFTKITDPAIISQLEAKRVEMYS